ncbi:MAG: apolipoprotein N-acyltransferase [Deltaproteobacteria bacterium]|nr:apolipoprotein N-acyltransferase [Deltaproteobacteria bacterium]
MLLCALATAAMLVAILPDHGLWYLTPVALIPLFFVLPDLSCGRGFLAGWLAGTLANMGIFHWIVHTAVTMSEFPFALALLVLLAFAMYSGLPFGLLALVGRSLLKRRGAVWTVPAALVTLEFLWPNLFPWHLGNAYFRVPLLMQGMDLTGIYGGSFVSTAVAVAAATWLRGRNRGDRVPLSVPVAAAILVAAWTGYGAIRLQTLDRGESAPTLTLALVQPDITAEDKKRRDGKSRKALFARLKGLTESADLEGVDAVVWPEGAFSFYFAPDSEGRKGWTNIVQTSRRLVAMVRDLEKPLVFGSLTRPLNSRTRNSLVMLGSDGREVERYDKRVLLAFGEYMPLSDTFPFLKKKVKEVSDMVGGDRAVSFPVGPGRALGSICYEAIFPTLTRQSLIETGSNLILNVTNDAWFGTSGAPAQHLMVQAPRTVELRVPLVRLTETGISAVIGPSGEFAYETELHERRVDRVVIPMVDGSSVYREVGDVFAWACVALVIASLATGYFRRKKSLSTRIG